MYQATIPNEHNTSLSYGGINPENAKERSNLSITALYII